MQNAASGVQPNGSGLRFDTVSGCFLQMREAAARGSVFYDAARARRYGAATTLYTGISTWICCANPLSLLIPSAPSFADLALQALSGLIPRRDCQWDSNTRLLYYTGLLYYGTPVPYSHPRPPTTFAYQAHLRDGVVLLRGIAFADSLLPPPRHSSHNPCSDGTAGIGALPPRQRHATPLVLALLALSSPSVCDVPIPLIAAALLPPPALRSLALVCYHETLRYPSTGRASSRPLFALPPLRTAAVYPRRLLDAYPLPDPALRPYALSTPPRSSSHPASSSPWVPPSHHLVSLRPAAKGIQGGRSIERGRWRTSARVKDRGRGGGRSDDEEKERVREVTGSAGGGDTDEDGNEPGDASEGRSTSAPSSRGGATAEYNETTTSAAQLPTAKEIRFGSTAQPCPCALPPITHTQVSSILPPPLRRALPHSASRAVSDSTRA
ncbi:hypothetical protein K438DRAFT_1966482 [Mycena galopus ATCC 62051]|nr:hypothetical protein K438DRAFT_1966482 [Mycena galopus ATCC 62051]